VETIGAIAAPLAKAQGQLTNPEKSLTRLAVAAAEEGTRSFRYASLASGLDFVRKCLGQHEIATVQTTAVDKDAGQIRLTMLLAHASGELLHGIGRRSKTWSLRSAWGRRSPMRGATQVPLNCVHSN